MRIQTQNRKPDLNLAINIIYKKCYLKEHSINSTYFNLSFQFLKHFRTPPAWSPICDYLLPLLSLRYQCFVSFWKAKLRTSQLLPPLPPSKTSVYAPPYTYIYTCTHTHTQTQTHTHPQNPKDSQTNYDLYSYYQLVILIP